MVSPNTNSLYGHPSRFPQIRCIPCIFPDTLVQATCPWGHGCHFGICRAHPTMWQGRKSFFPSVCVNYLLVYVLLVTTWRTNIVDLTSHTWLTLPLISKHLRADLCSIYICPLDSRAVALSRKWLCQSGQLALPKHSSDHHSLGRQRV